MKKKFQVFNANSKGKLKAQDSICISNKKDKLLSDNKNIFFMQTNQQFG